MKAFKFVLGFGFVALVSACADSNIATRNASIDPIQPAPELTLALAQDSAAAPAAAEAAPVAAVARAAAITADVRIANIEVRVPRSLRVSEANLYYPKGDIVWREDPYGDRHAQVQAIFEDALADGMSALDGSRPAILDVEVKRFHALTEKARFSVGGVHSIVFQWQLRDATSGEPLTAPRLVEADLEAFGGNKAIEAVIRGETQKVRISRHLAKVMSEELTQPEGHRNAKLGFFQRLNKI